MPEKERFEIGKAISLIEGGDVSIFATGHLVWHAVEAEAALREQGIYAEVINIHTIKPLDTKAVLSSVIKTDCAVSAEEHQLNGGLGSSIAQTLSTSHPTPLEMVGVRDTFGESGKPQELMQKYRTDTQNIISAVERVLQRKKALIQ